MKLIDIVNQVHDAFVAKAQRKVDAGESVQTFAEIGTDVTAYGQAWGSAVANDGKLDEEEVANISKVFSERFGKRIPDVDGVAVYLLWEGVTLYGFGFKGIKYYLNKWFELGL